MWMGRRRDRRSGSQRAAREAGVALGWDAVVMSASFRASAGKLSPTGEPGKRNPAGGRFRVPLRRRARVGSATVRRRGDARDDHGPADPARRVRGRGRHPQRLPPAAHRRALARRRPRPGAGLRLLHRHQPVHRLQGLRGRLQAVEPTPGRRLQADRQQLRQHRPPGRQHLAARGVQGADRRGNLPLADDVRRLQALRKCALPAQLPDRRDRLQHGRRRVRAERHLQRLRVLRQRLPVSA